MKLNKDDEYYSMIYDYVDELEFIEGYEFLKAKSPNTDAFDHLHMEIKNAGGDITLRVDANGVMITCGCGCMGMQELDYFSVCEVQKSLDQLIEKDDESQTFKGWTDRYEDDTIRGIFDSLSKQSRNRKKPEDKAMISLRRLEKSLDNAFDLISAIEDVELREQFLEKLQNVIGNPSDSD